MTTTSTTKMMTKMTKKESGRRYIRLTFKAELPDGFAPVEYHMALYPTHLDTPDTFAERVCHLEFEVVNFLQAHTNSAPDGRSSCTDLDGWKGYIAAQWDKLRQQLSDAKDANQELPDDVQDIPPWPFP